MKEEILSQTQPIPKLYTESITEIQANTKSDELIACVPTFASLKYSLYRERRKRLPTNPYSREEIVLSELWAATNSQQRFLIETNDQSFLLFVTDLMLQRLSQSDKWYMDGTFKTCPSLFYQIVTVNIYVEDKQCPAAYFLL